MKKSEKDEIEIIQKVEIPNVVGMTEEKAKKELDRLEHEKLEFHEKVYNGYLMLAERFKERVRIINGNVSIEEECQAVNDVIINFIKERGF